MRVAIDALLVARTMAGDPLDQRVVTWDEEPRRDVPRRSGMGSDGGLEIVELARRVVVHRSDESVGQMVGIGAAGVSLVVGPFVFRSGGTPLSGEVSLATVTSILTVVLGGIAFAAAYVRVARLSEYWRARSIVWRIWDTAGLTLAAAAISVMAVIAGYSTFQRAFQGLVVGRISATLLLAATVGVCCYTLTVIGHQMSSSRVAVLLGSFLAAGVFASMLTADNPGWWQSNFSALGISTSSSASAFNFTVVIAGIVLTTLADYLSADLGRWPSIGRRTVLAVRIALTVIGVTLIGLGVIPVNLSRLVHDIFAVTAIVGFGLLILAAPVLLRTLPSTFIVTTWVFGGLMLVIVLLWRVGRAYNFTAVELLSVLIIFAWLALFARTVASGPTPVHEEPVAAIAPGEGLVVPRGDQPVAVAVSTGPRRALGRGTGSVVLAAAAGAVIGAIASSYLHRKAR